ncbi:hypothetical protein DPMN_190871 [Dreissena polymorpha]|uniref:Uncharacterized protein n=1 Tax=Dreissena polymorpha TaxID=45954 RepID=A0A9D4BC26_DREPO|nr:hypothetical protein DPMN_190871 [Dreissena polymorpha]
MKTMPTNTTTYQQMSKNKSPTSMHKTKMRKLLAWGTSQHTEQTIAQNHSYIAEKVHNKSQHLLR